jgi:hypothetical protein
VNMKRPQRTHAEALDAYLTELQSGKPPSSAPEGVADEAALLGRLTALAKASAQSKASEPDPGFVQALGMRLEAQTRGQEDIRPARPSLPGRQAGFLARLAGRIGRVDRLTVGALAGAAAVVLLGLVLLMWLRPDVSRQAEGGPAEGVPTPVSVALAATAQPAPTTLVIPPVTASSGAAVASRSPITAVPAGATTAEATVPPSPMPSAPLVLPSLAALVASGLGGGGGARVAPPAEAAYSLAAALPESPDRAMVYTLREPEPLSNEAALETSGRWGLNARLYTPQPLAEGQSLADAVYVAAVDGAYQVLFEDARSFTFTDRNRSPLHIRCWQAGDDLPAEAQAIDAAQGLLQSAGLLSTPYQVSGAGNSVRFYSLLGGRWRLLTPSAVVSTCGDGRVGGATVHGLQLDPLGEVPILSAQEAWGLLGSGQPNERVWVGLGPLPAKWGQGSPAAPHTWWREYRDGQRVDLFRGLEVLHPVDPSDGLRVTMGSLLLTGDLAPLVQAHRAAVEATGDVEAPVHVWGLMQEADGVHTLAVQGWETTVQQPFSGTIRRNANGAALMTFDGETLTLPDLPADLPDGTDVFVSGGRINGRLEWHLIQSHLTDEGMPSTAPQPSPIEAVVDHIELVYLIPSEEIMSQDPASALPGWRTAQPVWLFEGRYGDHLGFTAYVQAAEPGIVQAASGG